MIGVSLGSEPLALNVRRENARAKDRAADSRKVIQGTPRGAGTVGRC